MDPSLFGHSYDLQGRRGLHLQQAGQSAGDDPRALHDREGVERGVSEDKLARALNVDIKRIKTKRTLLDGVCPEVAEMLKDKSVDTDVFTLLRKMKPLRQIEAVELCSR